MNDPFACETCDYLFHACVLYPKLCKKRMRYIFKKEGDGFYFFGLVSLYHNVYNRGLIWIKDLDCYEISAEFRKQMAYDLKQEKIIETEGFLL